MILLLNNNTNLIGFIFLTCSHFTYSAEATVLNQMLNDSCFSSGRATLNDNAPRCWKIGRKML